MAGQPRLPWAIETGRKLDLHGLRPGRLNMDLVHRQRKPFIGTPIKQPPSNRLLYGPSWEVIVDRALIIPEDGKVNIPVRTRDSSEKQVDRPAACDAPASGEAVHGSDDSVQFLVHSESAGS
jgi:hypothetical protein